jgi:monothiol glutaredoxin
LSFIFLRSGFSNIAVSTLNLLGVSFKDVDILGDEKLRAGLKIFSSWPTFPQLYVDQEFVGGADVMIQMSNNGELQKVVQKYQAQFR